MRIHVGRRLPCRLRNLDSESSRDIEIDGDRDIAMFLTCTPCKIIYLTVRIDKKVGLANHQTVNINSTLQKLYIPIPPSNINQHNNMPSTLKNIFGGSHPLRNWGVPAEDRTAASSPSNSRRSSLAKDAAPIPFGRSGATESRRPSAASSKSSHPVIPYGRASPAGHI